VKDLSALAVVIPCHDDCEAAEHLVDSFKDQTVQPDEIVIAHDRCKRKQNTLNYGNKAASINHYANILTSDYVLALDADMVLTPTFFESLKIAFQRQKPLLGSGLILGAKEDQSWTRGGSVDAYWYQCGGAMFIRRDYLIANPLLVDTVLDDWIYGHVQKKNNNVTGILVDNAVCCMERKDESLSRILKRQLRYQLGYFETFRFNVATRGGGLTSLASILGIVALQFAFVPFAEQYHYGILQAFYIAFCVIDAPLVILYFIYNVIKGSSDYRCDRWQNVVANALSGPSFFLAFFMYLFHRKVW